MPFLTSSIALGNPFLLDPGRPISSRYPCIVVPCSPPRGPGSAARADAAAAGSRRDLASPGGAPRLPSPPKQQRQHHQQRRLAPSLRLFVSATASASDAAPAPIQPLVPTTTTGQPAQTRTRGLALLLLLLAARSRGHGARNGAEEPAHSRSLVRRIASLVVGWPTLLMRAAGQPQRQRQLAPPPAPSSQPSCAASVSARRAAHAAPTPALRIRGGATGAAPRSCSAARAHGTRLRGDVFACTLPIMLLLFHVMLLWLFVQSATHYLLLLTCQVSAFASSWCFSLRLCGAGQGRKFKRPHAVVRRWQLGGGPVCTHSHTALAWAAACASSLLTLLRSVERGARTLCAPARDSRA